jgi:tetratricopeptide (TPR) repeat protein
VEQEVRKSLDLSEYDSYMNSAFKILRNEGHEYLDETAFKALIDALDKLHYQTAQLNISSLSDESLRDAFAIPEEIRQLILKIGIAKFNSGSMEGSLAIFTFLSTLNSDEPDYWYRLGLVAQKSEKYELALKSFAATSWLAQDFIGSRIFATQCYLQMGLRNDAETELEEAKYIIETFDVPEKWHRHIEDLKVLLAESP